MLLSRRLSERRVRRALRWVYHDPSLTEDDEVARIVELGALPGARDVVVRISRLAGSWRGMRPALGLGDFPGRITVPTLILWGAHDRIVPVSHAEAVRGLCDDAELTIFETSGHCPQMEVPDQFNERTLRFLAERAPVED
jgi:pimeloyl-ACP methyl ester carboxylesterase